MSAEDMSPRRRRRRYFLGFDEPQLPVKREPDEDIKDYAETTMNELLGWYGYEKVDSRDTQGLNLTHFAPGRARSDPSVIGTPPSSGADSDEGGNSLPETADQRAGTASDAASPGPDISSTISDESVKQQHQNASALPLINKHPGPPDSPGLPPGCIVCAWCQKVGVKLFTLKAPGGQKAFCSELCFDQCRRAAFKKSKVCDWCKHVRHTVSYVDFQDGEQRLQFCSDKCLNQYKMNLFCRETRAHLQVHARLKEAACKPPGPGLGLITPELWLRDCSNGAAAASPRDADENDSDGDPPAAPPSSPPQPEKKESPPIVVAKSDKPPKKSSPRSPHKKSHKSHRERRGAAPNGPQPRHHPAAPRQSPGHTSPSSSASRSSLAANGAPPLLSPASLGIPRPPPLHLGPHHGQGHLNFDHGRQQLMHAGVVPPPPFPFLAQQQMEAMLGRAQRGVDLRSAAKGPPPHLPLPPWIVPPFPPVPPPPQVPPPIPSFAPSSAKAQHHHKGGHASNHKGSAQHGTRHRHHGKKATAGQSGSCNPPLPPPPYFGPPFQAPSFQPPFPPLVPPVTVMVPFPLPIPIPLPVPVPIPIPPDVMERYRASKSQGKSDRGRCRPSSGQEMTNNRDSHKATLLEETAHRETWPRSLEANDRDIFKVTQPEETGDKEVWQPSLDTNDGDSTKATRSGETGDGETWQRSQETNDRDCYKATRSGEIGDRETWQGPQETNDRDCCQVTRPEETGDREPWPRSQETSDRDKPKSAVFEVTGGRDMNWLSRSQETIDQAWPANFQESNYRDRHWLASLQEVENKGKARCEQRRKRKISSGSSCSKVSRMLSDAEAASPETFPLVQRPTSADLDVDSVSCSPLSDAPSSCDDNADSHRPPTDEAAGLGLSRPSPVAPQAGADVLDGRVSTSPTDLSVAPRDQPPPLPGAPIGFKKRHLREQLPLVV